MKSEILRRFIALAMIGLFVYACDNTRQANSNSKSGYQALEESNPQQDNYISEDALAIDEDIEIESPRTAEPPPLPPVIEEVPEHYIEEEPEFVDQTISPETVVEAPSLPTKDNATFDAIPPAPPPPPTESEPEQIFKVVEKPSYFSRSDYGGEYYPPIKENEFQKAMEKPLSTFSIDVDRASYANVRRFLHDGMLPPPGAVRLEEMINYFDYQYPQPMGEHPFSVSTEVAKCPWNLNNRLLHIGIKGKEMDRKEVPSSNLVFLIDVSGSMDYQDKLPLLKSAFRLLINQLRQQDRVAMVVYAGASGLVLPSTSGADKNKIREALNELEAGGSTAGASGIQLAYDVAQRNFIEGGNNRIILATDGDFNVGPNSEQELVTLIEEKRKVGVFLSVLGFGTGNYKDHKMEQLADNGNGNYAYIDNFKEAQKVLVEEMSGTLFTIAKDVKLQLEFNPAHVQSYRLIGYENRILADRDFDDDTKDAGEIGAGHTVTALYEIIPTAQQPTASANTNELKYQQRNLKASAKSDPDLMTMKLRYKKPTANKSQLLQVTAKDYNQAFAKSSNNFKFSAAVASFGMLLRDSKYSGASNLDDLQEWATQAKGKDENGYRGEFIQLVELAKAFSSSNDNSED